VRRDLSQLKKPKNQKNLGKGKIQPLSYPTISIKCVAKKIKFKRLRDK
jgi:hypothetical protein